MDAEDIMKRVGVFALILVVVVGGVAASAAMNQPAGPTPADLTDVEVGSFDPSTITASTPATTGQITMSEDASGEVVLIDLAHENDVSEEQLGPVVRALSRNGAEVRFLTRDEARGPAFNESLRQADAFVSISPGAGFSGAQLNGLAAFEDAGGRVLLLGEPMEMGFGGTFFFAPPEAENPAPMASVASQFGLAFGNGYLYNMAENANNYRKVYATPAGTSGMAEGIDRVVVREGVPVQGGESFLTAIEGTAVSTTREQSTYAIGATSGNVTAVGDATFFTETGYQEADNEVLTGHLLDFLVGGEKVPGVPGGQDETGAESGAESPPRPPQR